jgi:hypothetical protein
VLAGKAAGVGFVLTGTDIAAIDLDKCRDPETLAIAPWARKILDMAPGAYSEVTASGTGLRIIGVAAGPEVHRAISRVAAVSKSSAAPEINPARARHRTAGTILIFPFSMIAVASCRIFRSMFSRRLGKSG